LAGYSQFGLQMAAEHRGITWSSNRLRASASRAWPGFTRIRRRKAPTPQFLTKPLLWTGAGLGSQPIRSGSAGRWHRGFPVAGEGAGSGGTPR